MSNKVQTWVKDHVFGIGAVPKAVLKQLGDYANDDGVSWPGKVSLARDVDCDKRTVDRAIKKLERVGLIKIQKRKAKTGLDTSNVYLIQMHQLGLFGQIHDFSDAKKQDQGVADCQGGQIATPGALPGGRVAESPNRGGTVPPEPSVNHQLEPSCMAQPPGGDRAVHDFFEKELWPNRPRRKGTDNKLEALEALCESFKRGNKLEDIQAGVNRYAAHIKATGQGGTRYVMRFSKFLGEKDYWKQEAWGPDGSTAPSKPATNNKPKDKHWHASMPGIWQKASDHGIMLHAYPDHTDLIAELIKCLEAAGEEVPEPLRERRRAMLSHGMSP